MKKEFKEFKEFINGKKVGVIGIGVSNRPLIDFLLNLGANVSAFDKKSEKELGEVALQLKKRGAELILGEKYLESVEGFDIIFKTPSMRIDHPALVKAKKEGTYVTSEMDEFVRYCPAKIYGITGSDGKTTTTTLVYNILKEQGFNTWIGGNIGTPLFTKIEEINVNDRVVLELSSFQLMTMDVSTDIALITNLSPNHLDIHKDMKEYVDSKKNIFKYQDTDDLLILNRDNDITNSMVKESKGKVIQFSTTDIIEDGAYFKDDKLYIKQKEVCRKDEIKLKGMHNVENLLAAFCAVSNEVGVEAMKKVATTFTGVEHRCEFIRKIEDVEYYNDSIASSPSRTVAGLKAFDKPVILIAGGYDKKIPFEPLAEEGYYKIKTLILVGATKEKIKNAFDKVIKEKNIELPIIIAGNLEDAVCKAKSVAVSGDVVTLSPACASFDMYPNFEARGNDFKRIINSI